MTIPEAINPPSRAAEDQGGPEAFDVCDFLRSLIDSRLWAQLRGPERTLLLCYARHANRVTGLAFPGDDLLVSETAMNIRNVQRVRKSLAARGMLVLAQPGGGRGKVNKWRIKTPARYATLFDTNPGAARPETPAQDAAKPRRSVVVKGGAGRHPKYKGSTQGSNSMKSAAAAACIGDLVEAGVEEVSAGELVDRFGVDLARAAMRKAQSQASKIGNMGGWIRTALEENFAGETRRPLPSVDAVIDESRRTRQQTEELNRPVWAAVYGKRGPSLAEAAT